MGQEEVLDYLKKHRTFVSIQNIFDDTNMSKSSIANALLKLNKQNRVYIKKGYIQSIRSPRPINLYKIK